MVSLQISRRFAGHTVVRQKASVRSTARGEGKNAREVAPHLPPVSSAPTMLATMFRVATALLIALALFCAPAAMHMGGVAMAEPTATGIDRGCEGMGHHSPKKQMPDSATSCAVACAAIPALPVALPSEALYDDAGTFTQPSRHLAGIGAEAELPPPRITSTI